ncbi:YD repeat-containing protein [Imtechella halotolerans K1]|uniref:YD repeat-containing protein n=2 Tax=Imtechella TaxID=1165076 RepID=I0W8P2_9FLAO|nr:YD repeat-containing protein [Imtechella halotolerans K1]
MNFTFRMYDPRLGRFFTVDPLSKQYPFYSPYQFSGNNVISHKELEGGEELIAITPKEEGDSFFSTVNGKAISVSIVTKGLETIGEKATAFSYSFAYKELAKGKLKGTNGKIYTVNELIVRDVTLIDGTVVENVTMASRNLGNQYFNTRQINQIEAFRSRSLKHLGSILEKSGDGWDAISLVNETANNGGQVDANSLLGTGITTYVASSGGFLPAMAVGLVVDLLGNEAQKGIDEIKEARRDYILAVAQGRNSVSTLEYEVNNGVVKDNFEVISMPTSILGDFLTGQIKTKQELDNAIWSDENAMLQRDSAILIEYIDDGNSIIVHKAYLNTKNSVEVNPETKSDKK